MRNADYLKTEMLVIKFDIQLSNSNYEYYKDETHVTEIEIDGQKHNILRNEDLWVVVWLREEIECSINVNCQEDVLYRILESIYILEELD